MIDNEWPNTGTKINFIIMGLLTILFFVPSFAQDNEQQELLGRIGCTQSIG